MRLLGFGLGFVGGGGGGGRAPLSREGRDQSVIGKMVVEESKET